MVTGSAGKLLHCIAVTISPTVLSGDEFSLVGPIVVQHPISLVAGNLAGGLVKVDLELVGPYWRLLGQQHHCDNS